MTTRRLLTATLLGLAVAVAVPPVAEASPVQLTSTTRCTGWHHAGYTSFQDKECINVAHFSNGRVRLSASVYGRRVEGDRYDGTSMRVKAVVRRGSGTRYASATGSMPLTSKYGKRLLLARVTHWYSRRHGTAVGAGRVQGTNETSGGKITLHQSHKVSHAY